MFYNQYREVFENTFSFFFFVLEERATQVTQGRVTFTRKVRWREGEGRPP